MRVGLYRTVKFCLHRLGIMASSMLTGPNDHLYMRPIQLYLNSQRDARIHSLMHPVKLINTILFKWWADLDNLTQGLRWKHPKPAITVAAAASLAAWGAHILERRYRVHGHHTNNLFTSMFWNFWQCK